MANSKIIPKRVQVIEAEKKSKSKEKIPTTYLSIAPFKQITSLKSIGYADETVLLTAIDTYVQVYKMKSYDLNLLNRVEKKILIDRYASFFRLFQDDFKVNSLMFPVDTSKQQIYWERKYRTAQNDVQKHLASNELRKLKAIEKVYKTQSHYGFLYANSMKEVVEKMQIISQFTDLVEKKALSRKDKEHLVYRLNNQDNE